MKLLVLALAFMLAGCANMPGVGEKSTGSGFGTDDFTESPCACEPIEMKYENQWTS